MIVVLHLLFPCFLGFLQKLFGVHCMATNLSQTGILVPHAASVVLGGSFLGGCVADTLADCRSDELGVDGALALGYAGLYA